MNNILHELYLKRVSDNEKNLHFWEDYLKNLQSIDFNLYADKLKVPSLVPVGNRILFRGDLKHTNEVTVSLGADYFVKCSISQAEILKQHRIKDAQSKVDSYKKEKEYLENHVSFSKQHFFENQGQEIVEVYSEAEDKAWRIKHRENLRKYKQNREKKNNMPKDEITDEELWNRLEELELQEDLEIELLDLNENCNSIHSQKQDSSIVKEIKNETAFNKRKTNTTSTEIKKIHMQTPKLDLLQKVIDKQNELENKLFELKNRDRQISKTEIDLISRMDEIEQLDELEDEMDRLDDILETDDIEKEDEEDITPKSLSINLKRGVSFADQDDSETLEITFKHSDVEPSNTPYNPERGVTKPSDIYESYSYLFGTEIASILKKPKYKSFDSAKITLCQVQNEVENETESKDLRVNRTIVVEDVVEKIEEKKCMLTENSRPMSLFRQRRNQNKI